MNQVTSPENASGRRRKYVSKACEQCRQRRSKCDGIQPVCSSCLERSLECKYSTAADHRKPASKAYVQLLRRRIDILEQVLHYNSIDIDAAISRLASDQNIALHASSHGDVNNSSSLEQLCAAFEGALSLNESLTFDQDGEVRYVGPTSGRIEFDQGKRDVRVTSIEVEDMNTQHASAMSTTETTTTIKSYVQNDLFIPELNYEQVDSDLRKHLTDLYFSWQHLWNPIVDETLFRQSETSNGRYFSPLLLNCILAAGARFSDRIDARSSPQDPTSAGRVFLERAEFLLPYYLKRPTLTTVQAVSIMVCIYIAHGCESAAWLHQGMAIRIAFDLGLNFDAASLPGSHLISDDEAELRRRMYWALYCDDKLYALYTGRVCTMLDVQAYVKLPSAQLSPPGTTESDKDTLLVTSLLRGLITLSQILEKVILAFYAPKPQYRGTDRETFFDACLLELQNWIYDLDRTLRLEVSNATTTVPQVYTLHLVFHTALILLSRGLLSVKGGHEVPLSDQSRQKALTTCYTAAENIHTITRKYRDVFGSFRRSPLSATHCIHSATLVFLQVEKTARGDQGTRIVADSARLCLKALEELSVAWSPARRIHQNLRTLQSYPANSNQGRVICDSGNSQDISPKLRTVAEPSNLCSEDYYSMHNLEPLNDYDSPCINDIFRPSHDWLNSASWTEDTVNLDINLFASVLDTTNIEGQDINSMYGFTVGQ